MCAASFKIEEEKHTSYNANYIQHLKYAGKNGGEKKIYFYLSVLTLAYLE